MPPEQPLARTDVLDAGRDTPRLRERWSRLGAAQRRAAALVACLLLLAGGAVAVSRQVERSEAAAARATVDLRGRFLSTAVLDRTTLGFRVAVDNTGPLPVDVADGFVALRGIGVLDAPLDRLPLPVGTTALPVRWGYSSCLVLAEPAPGAVAATELRLRVRTADGGLREVVLPLPGVDPDELVSDVACPSWRPLRTRDAA